MLTTKTQALSPALTARTPVRYLKGVGPEKEKVLARLGVTTLGELFHLFPRRHEPRFPLKRIRELTMGGKECVAGVVVSRSLARFGRAKAVFQVVLQDGPNKLTGVFYHQPYLVQVFKPKQQAVFYGAAEKDGKRLVMVHPEWEIFDEALPVKTPHHGRWVPIYPLTEDLSQRSLRQIQYAALSAHVGVLPEPFGPAFRERLGLVDVPTAFRRIHFPADEDTRAAAYKRLAFDEFFFLQLFIESRRAKLRRARQEVIHRAGWEDVDRFLGTLPFELTAGQKRACADIVEDMRSPHPMNRLVQGDVGSGKTAVAGAALFFTAKSGFQGALMAPTEVLARQLYMDLARYLEPFGVRVGLAVRGLDMAEDLDVAVGTHALLESKVRFKRLGLAIVDEQHKFGVDQRSRFRRKQGEGAHFLMMTATPIPRTLAMTLYGDMDISVIAEKPQGRQAVRTLCLGGEYRKSVYRWMEGALSEGAQAFVVCPWVDSKKDSNVKNALAHARDIQKEFSGRKVALLHGRMKSAEKGSVMRSFREGKSDILVSTVLIEVGVDVPRARFMLIENAEKFGLAQLHQLRGRVGRGKEESFCVLFSDTEDPDAQERLRTFAATESGFEIAEHDLKQRGFGRLAGEEQHGIFALRIGDPAQDEALWKAAKEEARALIQKDPALLLSENRLVRNLMIERYGKIKENAG